MSDLAGLPRYEASLVPVMPDVAGYTWIGCSDKRPPVAGSAVLPDTYYQLLGSTEIACDVAISWEVSNPGSFVEGGVPIEELGLVIAGVAQAYGLRLADHEECAALGGREAIAQTEASGSDYLRAKVAYGGDMSIGDYQGITAAAKRIKEAGLITPTDVAVDTLKTPHPDWNLPQGVPFATLQPTGDAHAFVVSHVPGQGFNVRRLAAQHPAYVNTFPAVNAIYDAVRNMIPIGDKDLLRMAYAARLGAISGHHILHNGRPYPLYVIDREGGSRVYQPEDLATAA